MGFIWDLYGIYMGFILVIHGIYMGFHQEHRDIMMYNGHL